MDFSHLPDTAFLKIIQCLPLENGIRIGRVDKSFRRIAQLLTSRTKSLDLDEDRFRNLTSDQLTVILDLCSSNLERLKLGDILRDPCTGMVEKEKAITLSNYECHRLIDINLGRTPIDYAHFEQLIRNNPNLQTLVWRTKFVGYPPNIINYNMNKLSLYVPNDLAIQSLIGHFPNLKQLDLSMNPQMDSSDVLDQFFGSIPQLNHFSLDFAKFGQIFRSDFVNFWNLPLISLSISLDNVHYCADDILHKLARSFKHLKKLHLDNLESTNSGFEALASLQDVEIMQLNFISQGDIRLDQGIPHLARCKKLQKLSTQSKISGDTLVNLLRTCPHLEYVALYGISQVDNPEEAAVVLDSLAGIAQPHINIEICSYSRKAALIWDTEPVKEVIGKLEENHGLKIKVVCYPWPRGYGDEGGYFRRWF